MGWSDCTNRHSHIYHYKMSKHHDLALDEYATTILKAPSMREFAVVIVFETWRERASGHVNRKEIKKSQHNNRENYIDQVFGTLKYLVEINCTCSCICFYRPSISVINDH